MQNIPTITTEGLRQKLVAGEPVSIIDIRPMHERAEWFIPGSIHVDAYDKLKQNDATVFDDVHLDKSIPVVTVCGSGKTSLVAAEILQQKGYSASSLNDGMKGWSLAWNTAYQEFDGFELWQIRRTGKGCLSYIVASNKEAIIIDASLPSDVYIHLINQQHLSVKYVIETHIHADHLSRSKELSEFLKAQLYLPSSNKVHFKFNPIKADTIFAVGSVTLHSIPTPGHTLESYSFYVDKEILITGDTLFTNGVGRPDLKSNAEESREKAKLLFRTLHGLLSLPDNVNILPAHTDKPIEFNHALIQTTIGEAKKNIPMLKYNEEEFVNSVLQKIPPTPPNFISIVEKNIAGNYIGTNPDLEAGANRCAVS